MSYFVQSVVGIMTQQKDNEQVKCNVDFFASGNSGTLSYSRRSLNDLGIGTNNSRSWDVSNVRGGTQNF